VSLQGKLCFGSLQGKPGSKRKRGVGKIA
jgi:hypothetical protein